MLPTPEARSTASL
jgi:hypothetical protein